MSPMGSPWKSPAARARPNAPLAPAPKMWPSAWYDAISITASGLAALFCQAAASRTQAASATMVALGAMLVIAVNHEQHGPRYRRLYRASTFRDASAGRA